MVDVIERIKQRTAKEYERLSIAITETDKFTKQGLFDCIKEFENTFIDIVDEELAKEPQECEWKLFDYDMNAYDTSCGESFYLADGTPSENKMQYCPYCSRKIKGD